MIDQMYKTIFINILKMLNKYDISFIQKLMDQIHTLNSQIHKPKFKSAIIKILLTPFFCCS